MKMRFSLAAAALSLTFSMLVAPMAQAQRLAIPGFDVPVCEGSISTFVLDAVPGDGFYWVDIFDKTDEALAFRETFLKTLRADGRKTNEDGGLVFNFESQSAFLGLSSRGGIDKAQGSGARDRRSSSDIGLSELRDTIREGNPSRRNRTSLGQTIDAKAELRDSKTGRVMWLATLSCQSLTGDRKLLMQFISKVIVDSLAREGGKTTF